MLYDIFAVVGVVAVLGTVLWVVWSMTRVQRLPIKLTALIADC